MSRTIEIKETQDAVSAVIEALERCQSGDVIAFPKEEYHFYPDSAVEKYCVVSNNTNGVKRIVFPILEKRKLTIDGQGARFVFHGEVVPFVIEDSCDIILKNFSMDWVRPFFSQALITAVDEQGVTIEIDREKYPYDLEDGFLVFTGEGWSRRLVKGVMEIGADTGAPTRLTGDGMGLGFTDDLGAVQLDDRTVRLTREFPHLPQVGNLLLLRHWHRCCAGIHLVRSKDLSLEDVSIHHAGAMGVIAQFCENVTLLNCQVTPSDGRCFSTVVDATHFVNCRGLIRLIGCLFEGQMDDASNVHGINTRVIRVEDEHTAVVEFVHYEQYGMEVGFSGDRVQLSDNRTMLAYAENRIQTAEPIDEQTVRVVFEQQLPEKLQPGHVLENLTWTADLHITNCTSRKNRARSYLISTPGKVIVENNRMASSGACIKISGDANYWFESGAVRDVLIRNNEFGDCCYGPAFWGRAAIEIDPEIADSWANQECFHRNIRIENNHFATFDVGILIARSVDGITFSGNTIVRTNNYEPIGYIKKPLTFEACRNINVLDDVEIEVTESVAGDVQ